MKSFLMIIMMFLLVSPLSLRAKSGEAPIVIFISFSMPSQSIKTILYDAEKIEAAVVIRGLIDRSFQKTINQIYGITQNNHVSLQIDPEIFKQYGIKKAPALLIRAGDDYQILYGDVAIDNLLKYVDHKNITLTKIADAALKKLSLRYV